MIVCNQRCVAAVGIKAVFHCRQNKHYGSPGQVIQFLFVRIYFIPPQPSSSAGDSRFLVPRVIEGERRVTIPTLLTTGIQIRHFSSLHHPLS